MIAHCRSDRGASVRRGGALALFAVVLFSAGRCKAADDAAKLQEYIAGLQSEKANERAGACEAIQRMGEPAKSAVSEVVKLLDDPEPRVRERAVLALGGIGPDAASAVPKIQEMVVKGDRALFIRQDNQMIEFTIGAIGNLGDDALPLLAALALTGGQNLDDKAILNYATATPAMIAKTADRAPTIRKGACAALGKLKNPAGLPVLLKILLATGSRQPIPKTSKKGKKSIVESDKSSTRTILRAIGDIGVNDPQAIAALKAYADREPDAVDTALRKIAAADAAKSGDKK